MGGVTSGTGPSRTVDTFDWLGEAFLAWQFTIAFDLALSAVLADAWSVSLCLEEAGTTSHSPGIENVASALGGAFWVSILQGPFVRLLVDEAVLRSLHPMVYCLEQLGIQDVARLIQSSAGKGMFASLSASIDGNVEGIGGGIRARYRVEGVARLR